jgi:hypothetical protein
VLLKERKKSERKKEREKEKKRESQRGKFYLQITTIISSFFLSYYLSFLACYFFGFVAYCMSVVAGLTLAVFSLTVCDFAGLCCVQMTNSYFIISEPDIFYDE